MKTLKIVLNNVPTALLLQLVEQGEQAIKAARDFGYDNIADVDFNEEVVINMQHIDFNSVAQLLNDIGNYKIRDNVANTCECGKDCGKQWEEFEPGEEEIARQIQKEKGGRIIAVGINQAKAAKAGFIKMDDNTSEAIDALRIALHGKPGEA